MKSMDEKVARGHEIRKILVRANEIKIRLRQLGEEHRRVITEQQAEAGMIRQWRGALDSLRNEFIYGLASRATGGSIPHIKFDSPAAIAFINADRWEDAFPELVKRVAGARGADETAKHLERINEEMVRLNKELSLLGTS